LSIDYFINAPTQTLDLGLLTLGTFPSGVRRKSQGVAPSRFLDLHLTRFVESLAVTLFGLMSEVVVYCPNHSSSTGPP